MRKIVKNQCAACKFMQTLVDNALSKKTESYIFIYSQQKRMLFYEDQNRIPNVIPGLPYFLGLASYIRLQILISAPVRVSAPPSDKRPLQISLNFDQKDGEPELILNQLTSKSLGLFFLSNILSNTCMLYKK